MKEEVDAYLFGVKDSKLTIMKVRIYGKINGIDPVNCGEILLDERQVAKLKAVFPGIGKENESGL